MTVTLLGRPLAGDTDTEFARVVDALTRREFLTGGAALGALGLGLAACGSSTHAGRATGKGWAFTDDTGRTVRLPSTPARVAVMNDPMAVELWQAGLHVVAAPFNSSSGSGEGATAGNYVAAYSGASKTALGRVRKISAADGSFDVEALAVAKPDLIVAGATFGKANSPTTMLGSQTAQITKLAPVVGLYDFGVSVEQSMASINRLVAALGITLADNAAKARYQAAAAKLRAGLATKPGLRVMFCWAGDTGLAVEMADQWTFMITLRGLGMRFAPPAANEKTTEYTIPVSWELVPALPVDLIVYDTSAALPTNPAWKLMPAVKAGQIVQPDNDRTNLSLGSYANAAAILDQITEAVKHARIVGPK